MDKGSQDSAKIIRFFSNPVVGLIGSLASIAGLILAVYFYLHSARYRELTYLVHPTKTVVVKSGQSSRLSVLLDGKKISRDITATQIAFWNNGSEPIRREHVLAPLIFKVGAPIIDARIRKKSREIVRIFLDPSRMSVGELEVTWNILEQGDGGVIQIIFSGGTETMISANAIVEGQPKVSKVALSDPKMLENRDKHENKFGVVLGVILTIILLMINIPILLRQRSRSWSTYITIIIMSSLAVIMETLIIILFSNRQGPPFGF